MKASGIQPTAHFGNMPMALNPATRLFSFFETSYEPGFLALSKLSANVIPRTAITRNKSERQEVLFNELTQGSTLFLALPFTSFIGDRVQALLSGIPRKMLTLKNEEAFQQTGGAVLRKIKVAKLGKSLGASVFIAALLICTTYLRNYRTIKRTGFSDYKDVVGLGGPRTPTEADRQKAQAAMQKNLNIIKGLLIGGAAAWLGIMAVFAAIGRKDGALLEKEGLLNPKRLNALFSRWAFVGKHSNQINGPFKPSQTLFASQALWVWGLPSYLGWLLGCRDKYETVEQATKFATFWAGYVATPRIISKIMAKKYAALFKAAEEYGGTGSYTKIIRNIAPKAPELAKKLIRQKNSQWALLIGMNMLVAGALPIIFNILFSKWRYAREHKENPATAATQPTVALPAGLPVTGGTPYTGINRRTFDEFMQLSNTTYEQQYRQQYR